MQTRFSLNIKFSFMNCPLCLNSAYSARLAAAEFNGSGLSIHSAHPGKTTMDQRICKAFSGYERLWSDTGSLSKPNSLNQALEFNCRGQGNDAKLLNASHSYLQLLQYIRSSIRYANAFTPHWLVDGAELFDLQGQVLYKQLSRVDCHSCCEGNLAKQSL